MKKVWIMLIFAALLLCSCSEKTEEDLSQSQTGAATEAQITQISTEPLSTKPVQHVSPQTGIYVYDFTGLVSQEDISQCNQYAVKLTEEYGIKAGVVFAENLRGTDPYEYAGNCYKELFGTAADGMLVLINNDTKVDIVYRKGICYDNIDDRAESEAFYYATKELAAGNYKNGAMKLLELGETISAPEQPDEEEATAE